MRELSPFYIPFPRQILRLSIALLCLLADGVLCFNSCLGSNDYWYEVQTTIGLLLA